MNIKLLLALLLSTLLIGCRDMQETKEVISTTYARLITKTEAEQFNVPAAAIGYLTGNASGNGMAFGLIWGMISADECKLPLAIKGEAKPQIVKAPNRACKRLRANSQIVVVNFAQYRKDSNSRWWVTNDYRWSEKWNREP